MILLALVVAGGKAFAQPSMSSPWEGTTYTYTVTGVTAASYIIEVTTTAADAPTEIADNLAGAAVSLANNSGNAGYSNASVTAEITWNTAGNYHIWLSATGSNGCTNYVYSTITVLAQDVEYAVYSLGETEAAPSGSGGNDITDVCYDEEDNTYSDNTTTMGSTVVYFAVVRSGTQDDSWQFTPSITGTYASLYYGTAIGSHGTQWTSGEITIASGSNTVYFEMTVDNSNTTAVKTFAATSYDEVNSTTAQTDATDDSATIELEGLPTVGTFSGL